MLYATVSDFTGSRAPLISFFECHFINSTLQLHLYMQAVPSTTEDRAAKNR